MAAWPSGKAEVCKTSIPRFKSGCRLQKNGSRKRPVFFLSILQSFAGRTFRTGRRYADSIFPGGILYSWKTVFGAPYGSRTSQDIGPEEHFASWRSTKMSPPVLRPFVGKGASQHSGHESVHSPPLVGPREGIRPGWLLFYPSSCCLRIALPVQSLPRFNLEPSKKVRQVEERG